MASIDMLINNAGISMRALFSETHLETLHQVMDTNFWGAVYCTKYALPYITKQKGTIVGISSIAGYEVCRDEAAILHQSLHCRVGWKHSHRVNGHWCKCYVGLPGFYKI